jgi:protoporphyrinogen oxidase
MKRVRTIILGAGPSGLSLAHGLLRHGDDSFVVLEKEDVAGGLCRSAEVDGAPLDIGGGHFLDVRRPEANAFVFSFLPESEWIRYERRSTIRVGVDEIDYPFEANLWQFPLEQQLDYLESIARAGCVTGQPLPASFRQWIVWKLGDRIAADYMLPYNAKIWMLDDLDQLGTYWLHKLPDVSFRDTLRGCLERRPVAGMPGHAAFYYPRQGGYGRVWRAMGAALGEKLICNRTLRQIDVEKTVVDEFIASRIVTTIPWGEFAAVASGIPSSIERSIAGLLHAAIEVAYHGHNVESAAHWTYIPDPAISHHRILFRHNFYPGSRGFWTETNAKRASKHAGWKHLNEYAYPLNVVDKPPRMARILEWAGQQHITGLGRWGEWEHVNSDAAVAAGLALGRRLAKDGIAGPRK